MNLVKYILLIVFFVVGLSPQTKAQLIGSYAITSDADVIGNSGDTLIACIGQSVEFRNNATTVITPVVLINGYEWDFNGALATNPTTPVVNTAAWTAPGLYLIESRVAFLSVPIIGTQLFSNIDSLWILIVAPPTTTPAPPVFVCQGDGTPLVPRNIGATDSIIWGTHPTLSVIRQDSAWAMPSFSINYNYDAYTSVNYNGEEGVFCRTPLSTWVYIRALPLVNTIPDDTLCIGDSAVLDLRPPLPNGTNLSFEWSTDRDFNAIIGTTKRIPIYNMQTTTRYYIRVIDGNTGCIGVDSMNVIVRPRPATPIASVLDSSVCIGDLIVLRSSDTSRTNFWKGPNGFRAQLGRFDIIAFTILQTGEYTIVSRDSFGCPSYPDSVYVMVNARPIVPTIQGASTFCEGDPLELSATPTGTTSLYWEAPNGDTLMGSVLNIAPDSIHYLRGIWKLWAVTPQGCRDSARIDVVIHSRPISVPGIFNTTICYNSSVNMTASIPNVTTYRWVTSTGIWMTSSPTPSLILNNLTRDTVAFLQVTTLQNCVYTIDSAVITVAPIPPPPPIYVDSLACVGERDAIFTTDPTAVNYFWTRNGVLLSLQDTFLIDTVSLSDAGQYTLQVVDNNGCLSDSNSVNFMVNNRPAIPVVDSFLVVCQGDPIFLTSPTIGGLVSFWRGPNGGRYGGFDTIIAPNSSSYGSGQWDLLVFDSLTTCRRRSPLVAVIVRPLPSIVIDPIGAFCPGDSIQLIARDSLVTGIPLTFTWYRDSLLTDTVAFTAAFTAYNIQGDSTFYVVAKDSFCTTVVKQITVSLPTIPPPPALLLDTISVCEGDTLHLRTTTIAINYLWKNASGFSDNNANAFIANAQPTDAGTYTLQVSGAAGCFSAPALVEVLVNSVPAAPFARAAQQLICESDTLFFTVDSSSQCDVLRWQGPNTATYPLFGDSLVLPPGDSNHVGGIWWVECVDTLTNCATPSNTVSIINYPTSPSPTAAVLGSVCIGDIVTLSVTSSSVATDIFTWYTDSLLTTSIGNSSTIQVGPITSNQTYYLVLTSALSCPSLPVPVNVSIDTAEAAPILLSNALYCVGDSLLLSAGSASNRYDWDSFYGWTSSDSAALVTPQVDTFDSGIYRLRVEGSNGCWTAWAAVFIQVNPTPPVPTAFAAPVCDGEAVDLVASAGNCFQQQWYGPNGLHGSTIFPSDLSYLDGSSWYVECIDSFGCTASSAPVFIEIKALPQLNLLTLLAPTCVGDGLQVTAQATTATGVPAQYNWYNLNSGAFLGNGNSLNVASVMQDFNLQLIVRDTLTGCTLADTTAITVRQNPLAPPIVGNLTPCEGDSLFLSTTVNASLYNWTERRIGQHPKLPTPCNHTRFGLILLIYCR